MHSIYEQSLQRDIDKIKSKVLKMGELAEEALTNSLKALNEKNQQIAYSIILRDRYIDEFEKELDRLCQEFLIRQLPAAGHLRFVYAVIKINNELERIGDYAESIARHFLKLNTVEPKFTYKKFNEIANLSIPMLRNALQSFSEQDIELAKATMKMEEKVDNIRYNIHNELMNLREKGKITLEALPSLMIITNRFERVADQSCNICEEVLYMCTGKYVKHGGEEIFRVLFVDERNACRAQMAEGIGKALGLKQFEFSSAGISPQPVDEFTIQFMAEKGIDISRQKSKYLNEIANLEDYQVVISLCEEADIAFPAPPTKTVSIRWHIKDPSQIKGPTEKKRKAYEETYKFLDTHIRDLVQAVLGDHEKNKEEVKNAEQI